MGKESYTDKYEILKNYRDNEEYRKSFNELAVKTFGINFEDWYQNGYWTVKYNPYSIIIDKKVVANVSVNITDFEVNGETKHYIQLGTVMTDKEYRNQGLIRILMEEIEKEYTDADGIYLFANDSVLEFYPKFGFQKAEQYEYVRQIENVNTKNFVPVSMKTKEEWNQLEEQIRRCYCQSAFEMIENSQLPMFYVSKYMQDNVFYSEELKAYIIAEVEDNIAIIDMVISEKEQDMKVIADGLGMGVRQVVLGFTPKNKQGFEVRKVQQEDTTLFIKGELKWFEEARMMFPLLAHA